MEVQMVQVVNLAIKVQTPTFSSPAADPPSPTKASHLMQEWMVQVLKS
jgi:hypothetical protein